MVDRCAYGGGKLGLGARRPLSHGERRLARNAERSSCTVSDANRGGEKMRSGRVCPWLRRPSKLEPGAAHRKEARLLAHLAAQRARAAQLGTPLNLCAGALDCVAADEAPRLHRLMRSGVSVLARMSIAPCAIHPTKQPTEAEATRQTIA